MNKVISMIALIVCSLGAAGAWAQYLNMDDMRKHTFCAQARIAFGMTYYELCETLGYEGYSLEKMRTIVNNARNKYGKCIESYYSTFVISALKQTTDVYCEKGNVYVGFAKQNSLKAYEKAFEAEGKAVQREQERKATENAKALQKELQKQRKADSIEQAKKIQAVMKDYSVGENKAKEILDSLRRAELQREKEAAEAAAAAVAAAYAAEVAEAAERREQELNKMCAEFYAITDSLETIQKTMKKYSDLTASERVSSGINYNALYKSKEDILFRLDWQKGIAERETGDKLYCLKRKRETSVGGN